MISHLGEYGEIAPGQPALKALLDVVRERIGKDKQARLDDIYKRIGWSIKISPAQPFMTGFNADIRSSEDLVGIGAEVDAFAYLD